MEKFGGNLPARPKLQPKAKAAPAQKATGALRPLATPAALATAKLPKEQPKKGGILGTLERGVSKVEHAGASAARDVGSAVGLVAGGGRRTVIVHKGRNGKFPAGTAAISATSVAPTVAGGGPARAAKNAGVALHEDPLGTLKHTVGGLRDAAAASPAGLLHLVTTRPDKTVAAIGKDYAKRYGETDRQMVDRFKKKGLAPEVLDATLAAGPVGEAGGAIARAAARTGRAGRVVEKVAKATTTRPALRVNHVTDVATTQKVRSSLQGAAITTATDAVRKGAQKVAVKRAASTRRVVSKPLRADRQLLKPGEVAPVTRTAGNRSLRLAAATNKTRERGAANYRIHEHVSGDGRTAPTLRSVNRSLKDPAHKNAVIVAQKLGIRDAAGARAAIPVRIAKIHADRANALARAGTHGVRDFKAETHGAGSAGELAALEHLKAHPEVFDLPHVKKAIHDSVAISRTIGPREGLAPSRAALGRSQNLGHTLGVKTAAERNAEAQAAKAAERAAAARVVATKRAEVIKQQQAVTRGRLVTREAAIGKGLGGKVRVGDAATLKSIARHAGKRNGMSRIAGHAETLVRDTRGLKVAKAELRAARENAARIRSTPHTLVRQTAHEYEAAVKAANAKLHPNLVGPEHVPAGFVKEGLPEANITRPAAGGSNPLAKTNRGILDRLGRSETDHAIIERDATAKFAKGAAHEYENKLIADHGKVFPNERALQAWAKDKGLNLNADRRAGKVGDVVMFHPSNGLIRKDLAPARKGSNVDHGAYHKTDAVVALPRAVADELKALHARETGTPNKAGHAIRAAAHYSQAALLGGSLSWFQFQRVNDLIAAAAGGSLHHSYTLHKLYKNLDPQSKEIVHIMSGGSISSSALRPDALQQLGRMRQVLDSNSVYQRALASRNPASALLRVVDRSGNPLTALLRADQKITGGVRDRQFLHNLSIAARKMDPDVAGINRALGPLGNAFKTADMNLVDKLLKDPANQKLVEDAAQRLYRVHGDWSNYTAAERKLGQTAAFYGFLRYATRMVLFNLPMNHPYFTAILGQLGSMQSEETKRIIGPDQPWMLGALFNKDGSVKADFTRANPLLSPIMSIRKTEDLLGLATPLASIMASYVVGHPIGLSDSANGYIRQYTAHGDPKNHTVGGFGLGSPKTRIALRGILGLLGPAREWDKFDSTAQSDDSLPWDRRPLVGATGADQNKIDAKNAHPESGVQGLLHREFPLFVPGSKKNYAQQGASIAGAKDKAAKQQALTNAKRDFAVGTPMGRANTKLDALDAKLKAAEDASSKRLDDLDFKLKLLEAKTGG